MEHKGGGPKEKTLEDVGDPEEPGGWLPRSHRPRWEWEAESRVEGQAIYDGENV